MMQVRTMQMVTPKTFNHAIKSEQQIPMEWEKCKRLANVDGLNASRTPLPIQV